MIVYKAYLKIIKKNIGVICMYLGIFMGIILINIANIKENDGNAFSSAKVSIAVFNHDGGVIGNALENYLYAQGEKVELKESREAMQDALFYRAAEYIVVIPEGFTEQMLQGQNPQLERVQVADSYSGFYVDSLADKYLNLVRLYQVSGMQEADAIVKNVEADLQQEVAVEMVNDKEAESNGSQFMASAFNFTAYIILALGMLLVGITLAAFNDPDRHRRMLVSPLPPSKLAKVQILCNALLLFAIVTINYVLLLIIMPSYFNLCNGIILYVNMLLMGMVSLACGYLLAMFVKTDSGRSGAVNTVALGMSFLCGVFVPLSFLGEHVQKIGRCLPAYWFVKVNEKASAMTAFTADSMKEIGLWMGIQCLFIVVLFGIALILVRRKGKGSQGF